MVRQSPRSRPDTLELPRITETRNAAKPRLVDAAREVNHGRTTVVFPWYFEHSPAKVWAMLTDPDQLARWSPFTADRDLSQSGRATLTMLDGGNAQSSEIPGVVFVADSPLVLEYSWADDTLTWTLGRDGSAGATHLVLRQTLANDQMASAVAAGWHLCLDVASSVLDEHPIPPIRGMAAMDHGWADLNRRYARKFGVKPTHIG
jgi:uncharacterized protein YndB with AHSA1/START domain